MNRLAGILLPVSSLPSPYGIGTLGKAAFDFIDFLKEAGQSYWQVLPIGPTGFGDSPYQSFSAFAGNPYFIDIDILKAQGLLTDAQVKKIDSYDIAGLINYEKLFFERFLLLKEAFCKFDVNQPKFTEFCQAESAWLDDYALYMALKEHFGHKDFQSWPDDIRLRTPATVNHFKHLLASEVEFWQFCQFSFFEQWASLKRYANKNGISLIGDIPIYVSGDGADIWANMDLFQMDENGLPLYIAGVPPDYFSATGQRWGNPLYDWHTMEQTDFDWWKKRIASCSKLFDVIRIDHFIGIARYYAISPQCKTAIGGEWREGPGEKLINAINTAVGSARIIAEDLGVLHPSVKALLEKSGYPGMKVLLFAADGNDDNPHIPFKYEKNTTVYVGTHDNDTVAGFCKRQKTKDLAYLMDYFCAKNKKQLPLALIKGAFASVADTAIVQLQDWLELDNTARMNVPSTIGKNWVWRLSPSLLTPDLAEKIKSITELYARTKTK
ncbi:MAG TPA: 4-alpha-glucanotransferase [Clostridia bacterium]|nr:4-alpha-glucanotransferase [Clostridia bacterium]